MKQELGKIYRGLSARTLSMEDALARLRVLRQAEASASNDTLLASVAWEPGAPAEVAPECAQHHVFLCDLPRVDPLEIEKLLPNSRCSALAVDPASTIAERYTQLALACFEAIQSILRGKPQGRVRVHMVIARNEDAPIFAGLAGLLETAALENPLITGQILFAPSDITVKQLTQQLRAERACSQDRIVEYKEGTRWLRRWQSIKESAARQPDLFKEKGVYLITGGLGGLGVLFAREIQQRTTSSRIILTGRTACSEKTRAVLESLRRENHRIEYRQLDVTDLNQVRELIAAIMQEHEQLNGIIHSAGVVRDDFILKKTAARFREVLLPKVTGTYNLDVASERVALDFLLLFSSIASWSGNVGQADYAAANGFMNEFAEYRKHLAVAGKRHGRTLALLWPHWLEGGMSTDPASMAALRQQTGMGSLDTESGMQAFHRSLASEHSQVLVMRGEVPQMLRALLGKPTAAPAAQPEQRIGDTVPDLTESTREFLRSELAGVLKMPAAKVNTRAPLESYGIDSIMAMNLTARLEQTFGVLAKTLFFEYLTIDELTGYFVQSHAERLTQLFAAAAAPARTQAAPEKPAPAAQGNRRARQRFRAPVVSNATHSDPIAIVGLSGRYPASRDLEAFWCNLRDGIDCITEIPAERWDWKQYYSEDRTKEGAHYSRWGGFIEGVDEFDPRFFNIAPREAHGIDPQERLFLQHAWMAIEDAGYTRASLQAAHGQHLPGQVGVYAGVMYGEYNVSGTLASIANRVSYFLNVHGPSLTLDTMCSSSLTAIHLACQDLRLGRTSLALAGGVNVSIHPNKYQMLSGGQFISSAGHCQSFGEGGDGYIPGEGVGVAVLKRLSEAQRDGNHIYGVIRSSALNHGGKTNGYTVPNPQAQADVIRMALLEANIQPRQVSYIEAHGTGTKLGDPIEIAALSKAFKEGAAGSCRIGSAKSNIGHCESAAGIAGITKVLLQMQHQQIVPSLHSRRLNPHIDFETTPFVVNQSLTAWQPPEVEGRRLPRIAGISSFGAGGSNAHVLIEEYPARPAASAIVSSPVVVPLSARTAQALRDRARDLLAFIGRNPAGIDLASMAYTLQVGREAMEDRAGFLVGSVQELADRLEAFLDGKPSLEGVYHAQVKAHREQLSTLTAEADFHGRLEQWMATRNLPQLLSLWVKGLELDWSRLAEVGSPARLMSLPAYPFARERYWVAPATAAAAPAAQAAILHPLLHANTSNLAQHRYTTKFTGAEAFLENASGSRQLPALLTLEMMRAAAGQALPQRAEAGIWELRETAWGEPLAVTADRLIHTVLFAREGDQLDIEVYSSPAAGESSDEPVHCQSRAVFSRQPAPTRLDLARLKAELRSDSTSDERQLLEEVDLAARSDTDQAESLLHPQLLKVVSQLAQRVTRQAFTPVTLERIRVIFPCPGKIVAWVRGSASGSVDIDVCDSQGNICVQLIGLQGQAAQPAAGELAIPAALARKKPTRIALQDCAELDSLPLPVARATVSLSAPAHATAMDESSAACATVRLFDDGGGVFVLDVGEADSSESIDAIAQALHRVQQDPAVKVLVLKGAGACGRDERNVCDLAIERGLFKAIAAFPYPVIAALEQSATGSGFLMGAVCDFMVLSDEGRYGFSDSNASEASFFRERLGDELAIDFLRHEVPLTGCELASKGWTCRIVPAPQVEANARQLATALAQKPQLALRLLKTHLGRHLLARVENLTAGPAAATATTNPGGALGAATETARSASALGAAALAGAEGSIAPAGTPVAIPLRSSVISASAHPQGIVVVNLHDRQAKNMFSEALVSGLKEVFAHIAQSAAYKVVILAGYDSYFATGGTQETLLAIQKGEVQFTDEKAFQLPMECALPVIAAMQGHAIGGGWSFGMFADVALLSEESRYVSPYMNYGFTPGAGSTLVFPKKIGYDLARETLLAAQEVSGAELKVRGLALPILPRRQVLPRALELAQGLAHHSREQLMQWKGEWTRSLREIREETYQRELAMHEQTFVGRADTLTNIQAKFAADSARAVDAAPSPATTASTPAVSGKLRELLAQELHLRVEEIGEDAPFIDLGLDSITGVTWIRRINAHYGTAIEATKVYSYPTLTQLSGYIAGELGAGSIAVPVSAPVVTNAPAADGVVATLKALLAKELHLRPEEIDENAQFIDLGLDSITGVTWIRKINEHYGALIEATKVYSYPTLNELGRYVQQEAGPRQSVAPQAAAQQADAQEERTSPRSLTMSRPRGKLVSWRHRKQTSPRLAPEQTQAQAPSQPQPQSQTDRSLQPIAVIGMAGQFARAKDLDELWNNLAAARNCIEVVPDDRWSLAAHYKEGAPVPGKTYSKWLGALDEYDRFDPLFFNIAPTEAQCMDPQQRLFLQTCWHSIENAGYNSQSLSGSQCGVFVGCGPGDYHHSSREQQLSAQGFTGAATSILAARIAYFLNLRGPCLSIDTACSSSLVAIATACDSLNAGNSDLALAGGVYVMSGPTMHIMTSQAGMLSSDGRCFSFDERANGFVPGEGVGVVVLKRLSEAHRDQDRILGVIEGWGVNQDGRTNGITAPNEESQTRLLQSVYRKFNIDPAGIQLIEAHGTGTRLGDPIEVAGLKAAFKPFTDRAGYCALGSIKSNIGHCLTAAGAAGIIKLLLALQHRCLPPTINFQQRNEHIQFAGSPFFINDSLRPWNVASHERRRAAISSFGFSGTNAHIVLAEHVATAQDRAAPQVVSQNSKIMVCLSARTEAQLRQKAVDLLAFIRRQAQPVELADLAYTLHVGRDQMGERLGFLVSSIEALTAKLDAHVSGEEGIEDVYQGQVKRHREAMKLISQDDEMRAMIVGKWLSERQLSKLLELWVKGIDLDWSSLYGAPKPRRIELPGYPFAKERFWIEAPAAVAEAGSEVIHPLLHRNVSVLGQQRYRSVFNGAEPFLEQTPAGTKILPASSLQEMAGAAIRHATSDLSEPVAVEFAEIVWAEPLVIDAPTEVFVTLDAQEDEGIAFEIHSTRTGRDGSSAEMVHAQGIASLGEPLPARVDAAAGTYSTEPAGATLAQSWDGLSYLYKWEEHPRCAQQPAAAHKTVLIVCSGSTHQLEATIRANYEQGAAGRVVLIRMSDRTREVSANEWLCGIEDAAGFQTCLQGLQKIDALYFLAMPDRRSDAACLEESAQALAYSQQANEVQLLRLVKCLRADNRIDGAVDTYLLTLDNYSLDRGASDCGGAGVTGLGYSLAQGSYQFRVRNLDLSSQDLRSPAERTSLFAAVLQEPASDRGEVIKLHCGKRYRQAFFRLAWPAGAPSGIRHNGVYLILGGSGLVGQAITRNLIEKYQANVVWFGRSAQESATVQMALKSFAAVGDKLLYVQADTLQPDSLRQAVSLVKQKYGRIHGAVFSAMVFGIDDSIEHLPEADFRSVLDIKTLGSLMFHGALQDEPLDFMCYFSSGQAYSFSGAAKVCGYAAGIAFTDGFVRSIRDTSAFAVGTINWGAWQAFVRERLSRMNGVSTKNMGALDDREGFECFEQFVSALQQGGIHQVMCMRASDEVLSLMNCNQTQMTALTGKSASAAVSLDAAVTIPRERIAHLRKVQENSSLDEWFIQLLFHQMNRLIEAAGAGGVATVAELCERCGIIDKYAAWVDSTLQLFAGKGYVDVHDGMIRSWGTDPSPTLRDDWRAQKEVYARDPDTSPLVSLVDEILEKLADILRGKVAATDVIFPNSSMEKVAPLYKDNSIADSFNEIVANAVRAYLTQRLQHDPRSRLRILEIGAGTGGTSAAVFAALKPYQESVEEYCYTDLSKAFFFHAQKHYLPDNPYIVCRRLDIEQPIAAQGIEIGGYDLVIATNVLHATRNIRQTLRNAKAALRADGFIVLNEMSHKSLATHLTFAMLDGWWMFQDAELRIPGCPGLYPAGWQRALQEEGFHSVSFPAEEGHVLGNQIVIARSDGVIRQPVPLVEGRQSTKAAPRVQTAMQTPPAIASKPGAQPQAVPATAAAGPAQDIGQFVRRTVLSCLSGTLKIAPEAIDVDTAFADYGIDSILGVSFVEQLNARLAAALNTAVIFEYSSVERLSNHVLEAHREKVEAQLQTLAQSQPGSRIATNEISTDPSPARSAAASARGLARRLTAPVRRSTDRARRPARADHTVEIAVIGMSGKFPKAQTVHELWQNLIDGVDGVQELPDHYLDMSCFSATKAKGRTRCKWGGILAERDCFDPLFFNLSPREALSMNPHQRLVMQESWNALEDAGIDPKALAGTQTGVFIGSEPTQYAGETFTGLSDAIIASRLSYVLNLRGPAFVVNTGCSASAVALHLACESLRNRESELAVAGGVNACMRQTTQIVLDEIDMLSPSGRCFTFDKAGDGTIISEGIGMVVLKRLDDAIAAGDPIYGTIVASGINQDGASNGITAPNGAAQEQLITSVYDKFGIDPERIGYVEAHGTGTRLGDPIETNALVRAFRRYTDKQGYCAVGSAKSHIGHTAAAAGVIGLIKVLLSMRHRTFPKLLNFKDLNPLIEFAGSPFFVTTQRSEWKSAAGMPRMAAINSFGHSGTNAHIVVKECVQASRAPRPVSGGRGGDLIIPLSAKTQEQLRQKVAELLDFIRSAPEAIELGPMAYTLQIGREAMEERLAFVASSMEQLTGKLRAHLEGEKNIDGVYRGQASRNSETLSLAGSESAASVATLWAEGRKVTWSSLWGAAPPERMHLPGYPFAKERYWIESDRGADSARNTPSVPAGDGESIEDIINRIANESLAAHEGVRRLRQIV